MYQKNWKKIHARMRVCVHMEWMCTCRLFCLYAIQTASHSFSSDVVADAVVVIVGQDANCINIQQHMYTKIYSSSCVCVRIQVYNLYKLRLKCFKNLWFCVIVYEVHTVNALLCVRRPYAYAYVCTHINDVLQYPTKENCAMFTFQWIDI